MNKIISNFDKNINKGLGKAYNWTATKKWCAKTLDYATKNPNKYATAMVVTSIVSKDLVGCYYYVTQSLHNKKIPEEKRKFVASLDLMNGIIMVGGQLMAGILFEKTLNKFLFKKFFDKKLDNDILKIQAKKAVETAKKAGKEFELKAVHQELIEQIGSNSRKYKAMKTGFNLVVVFAATTALTKRVIAPLFATPLAGWYKEKFMDKKKSGKKNDLPVPEPISYKLSYQPSNTSNLIELRTGKKPF